MKKYGKGFPISSPNNGRIGLIKKVIERSVNIPTTAAIKEIFFVIFSKDKDFPNLSIKSNVKCR